MFSHNSPVGLETFYQMYNGTDGTVPTVDVSDWARFEYRGLLIDTSRHYLTVPVIKRVTVSVP